MDFLKFLQIQYIIGALIALAFLGFLVWAYFRARQEKPKEENKRFPIDL